MHDGIGISQNGKSFVWNNKSFKKNRKTLVWLQKVFTSCDTGQRHATGTNDAGRPNSAAGSFFLYFFLFKILGLKKIIGNVHTIRYFDRGGGGGVLYMYSTLSFKVELRLEFYSSKLHLYA